MATINNRSLIEMIKKYFYLILVGVLIIGGVLRIINLDKNPPHLGNDEISIAFDSYSVRMIGKDEWGHDWPLSFESHRTYKAPLYAYLNMPINYLLGNNEVGVRLLSALAGILVIFLVAIIAKAWSGERVALVAAMIMALNPKSIFASRIAFESNLAFMILTLGILLMYFYRKTNKNIYALIAGLVLGLSIWGYHTEWGLSPMVAVVLPWLSRKEFNLKKWWLMWLTLIIVALPIFYNFVTVQIKDENNRASSQIWFSEPGATAITPVISYLQHFSLDSLFTSGSDIFNGESPLESGWFLLATLPLLIWGLINLKVVYKKYWDWILAWWLLCPVVPALTAGGVASVRNLAFLVPTILIMAAGFEWLIKKSKMGAIILSGLFFINFFIFGLAYFIHFPIDSGDNFQYGYKQAWEFIKPMANNYDQIVVETKFGNTGQYAGLPHLYFGYFGAFGVEEMQHKIDDSGTRIGKFYFKYVDWNKEELKPKTLYVVSAINPMAGKAYGKLNLLGKIEKPNHETQFWVYEVVR